MLSYYNIIRDSLSLATHQRKINGDIQLINVDSFKNNPNQSGRIYPMADPVQPVSCLSSDNGLDRMTLINTHSTVPVEGSKITIQNLQRAKLGLQKIYPFLEHLSFNGYVLAGGSVLNSVRTYKNHYEYRYLDLDFFIYTGITKASDNDRLIEMRAREIFITFMLDLEEACKKTFYNNYTTSIVETEESVTIVIRPGKKRPKMADTPEYIHPPVNDMDDFNARFQEQMDQHLKNMAEVMEYRSHFTIQIIKRAYSCKSQILRGFDLWPSQVLYDGESFLCTDAFRTSVMLNVIPLDISRASFNWSDRLYKYVTEKRFYLVMVGLNLERVNENLEVWQDLEYRNVPKLNKQNSIYFPCGFSLIRMKLMPHMKEPKYAQDLGFVQRGKANQFLAENDLEIPASEFCNTTKGKSVSDYSDELIENLVSCAKDSLDTINLKRFIAGSHKLVLIGDNITEHVSNPKTTKIKEVFYTLVKDPKSLSMPSFKFFFGDLAQEALMAVFQDRMDDYLNLINKRVEIIFKPMSDVFDGLKARKWKICDPQSQNYGAFNPVNLNARNFYGYLGREKDDIEVQDNKLLVKGGILTEMKPLYNGFHCTLYWPEKLTIIAAKRRKEPNASRLLELSNDLWKLIFFILDANLIVEVQKNLNHTFAF